MTGAPDHATVLDTTVLSNFAHVHRVDLLHDLPRLVTVDAVRDELEAGADSNCYLEDAVTALEAEIPVVTPPQSAVELESRLLETLDPGEAQVLAVTEAVDGTAVTDDGDARTIANRRDVAVTGSIGLLVRFVETDQLNVPTADDYLKHWIDDGGFRSPARDITVFLEE